MFTLAKFSFVEYVIWQLQKDDKKQLTYIAFYRFVRINHSIKQLLCTVE